MRIEKKRFIIYLVVTFCIGALVSGGLAVALNSGLLGYVKVSREDYDAMSSVYERYDKLDKVYQSVEENFYKDIDEAALIDGACDGLVDALNDPYSAYLTAEEYENWKASVTGQYSGIGITFSEDETGNYMIVSVTKDSPAERAGLQVGDYILEADDKTYDTLDKMATAIRGEEGSEITIKYRRNDREHTVTMLRENIIQHSVESKMLDEDTGYIQISSFIESTSDDFKNALKSIQEKGAETLVLDLRNNGGGLVTSCVDVADEFLDEGLIVYAEDKNQERMEYEAKNGKTDLKTVVLVNENSASASEILAAALQDNGVELVGQTTYGKGVIQSTAEISDGSAIKLTIMQYFSPKGNAIHEKGVKPDYEVKNEEGSERDAQLEKAMELL